jgi:molecular chaperone GrpE
MKKENQSNDGTSESNVHKPEKPANDPPTKALAEEVLSVASETELTARLQRLEEKIDSLHSMVEKRLLYDKAKETAFDRLYADLDRERKNVAGEFLKPILRDILQFYDHVVEAARQHPDVEELLGMLREGLLEVLYRADVEPIDVISDKFDRKLQCVKRVEATEKEHEDWTVAEVIRDGFRQGDSVLRPQQVVVRRFKETQGEGETAHE